MEHPSSDGGKANDSMCSASRVTRKGPRSISRSRVAKPLLPTNAVRKPAAPADLNKRAVGQFPSGRRLANWPADSGVVSAPRIFQHLDRIPAKI